MAHTPGPWSVIRFYQGYELRGPNNEHISLRDDGNARLITAAPQLLEALEDALEAIRDADEGSDYYEFTINTLVNVIRAAKGE